jgi:hypothetical protein
VGKFSRVLSAFFGIGVAACTATLAYAALLQIQHPTQYTNGAPLKKEDISHYEMCYELAQSDACDKVVTTPVADTFDAPCWAARVKGRTVMKDATVSDWSEYLEVSSSCNDLKPMPPVISNGSGV